MREHRIQCRLSVRDDGNQRHMVLLVLLRHLLGLMDQRARLLHEVIAEHRAVLADDSCIALIGLARDAV